MGRSPSPSRLAPLLAAVLAACASDPVADGGAGDVADGGVSVDASVDAGATDASDTAPDTSPDDAGEDPAQPDADVALSDSGTDVPDAPIGADADAGGPDATDAGDVGPDLPPEDTGPIVPTEGCWSVSTTSFAFEGPRGTTTWDADGPLPTNDWWTSLAWNSGDRNDYGGQLYADPIIAHPDAAGLDVHHAREPSAIGEDGGSYWWEARGRYDLHVGPVGLDAPETRVVAATDWTVVAAWADDEGRSMEATIGRGTPYVWARIDGAPVRIETEATPTVEHEQEGSISIDIDGRAWGVFAAPGTSWTLDDDGLTSDAAGWVVVAPLPDAERATFELFATHAFARPVDTRVSWRYDEAAAMVETTYDVTTEAIVPGASDVPLVTLYPHQWRATDAELAAPAWSSARGTLRSRVGASYTTRVPFHGILPVLPMMYDAEAIGMAGMLAEVSPQSESFGGDTYFASGSLARLGRYAAIADMAGDPERRAATIGVMQRWLEDWFSADDNAPPLFVIHEDWSTLVGYPSSFFTDTLIVDHHFHWGYFVSAAAHVALWDRTWARDDQWGGAVKMLVRDVADPLRDDVFPFLRSFDVYAGHSWAGGTGFDGAGNNQESSSESMNLASHIALFGEATGNDELRDLGIWLYVTETSAIGEYWFDVHDTTFPEGYEREVVGILWGSGAAYGTWWTGEPEAIHGINWLPFHGGSLYLGLWPEHLADSYAGMVAQDGGVEGHEGGPDDWVDVVWLMQALYDADTALAKLEDAGPSLDVGSGETRAHVNHWIRSLHQLGRVDPDVLADVPTYAVFARDGERTHVAYNARCAPRDVTFTDGVVLSVGPRQLVARRPDGTLVTHAVGSCEERALEVCGSSGPSSAIIIESDRGDARVHTAHGDPAMVDQVDDWGCSLGEYYAPGAGSCVFFFGVPEVPEGTTLRGATFRLQVHSVQDADGDGMLPFGADLYLLGTRDEAAAVPEDAFHGPRDEASTLLLDDLLAPTAGEGFVTWEVPADSPLMTELRAALAAGTGFVTLRVSPDANPIPDGWNQWRVLTSNSGQSSEHPRLVLDLEVP